MVKHHWYFSLTCLWMTTYIKCIKENCHSLNSGCMLLSEFTITPCVLTESFIIGSISETGSPYCSVCADKIWNHDQLCTTYIQSLQRVNWIPEWLSSSPVALNADMFAEGLGLQHFPLMKVLSFIWTKEDMCVCVRGGVCVCVCVCVCVLCINTPTNWRKAENNLLVLHPDSPLYLKLVIIKYYWVSLVLCMSVRWTTILLAESLSKSQALTVW